MLGFPVFTGWKKSLDGKNPSEKEYQNDILVVKQCTSALRGINELLMLMT